MGAFDQLYKAQYSNVKLSKYQNLKPIWVNLNDARSTVHSDVELISWFQFIFTMYNGLQYVPV